MKIKILFSVIVSIFLLIYFRSQILANCWQVDGPYFQCGSRAEDCTNNPDGTASGTAVYSCGSYDEALNCTGCFFHNFRCDTPCGSPGVPGGGGGGGFTCPMARVDCPVGSVRGSTLVGSQCESYQCQSNVGSAQQQGSCCAWNTPPRECSDWYCGNDRGPNGNTCGFRSDGSERCCRDCTQEPPWCVRFNYETYNCVSVCSATAPTNVAFTPISLTSARLNWTPGTGGTTQYVYVGTNRASVEANCASGCAVSVNLGSATQSSYTTPQVLTPGSVYYYRVTNSAGVSCSTPSATGTSMISCTLSPTSLSLSPGGNATITASVGNSSAINRVDFVSTDTSIVTVNPASDSSYPYTTTATAVATGTASVRATVYYTSGGVACQTGTSSSPGPGNFPGSQNTSVTVINPNPWWQVEDGDVQAGGGITSAVPAGEHFSLPGLGSDPGVPVYTGSTNLTNTLVSPAGWLAQSATTGAKLYNYAYFANQIPADTVITTIPSSSVNGTFFQSGGTLSHGYYWYRYTGTGGLNLTISSPMNLGNRRVVLLVQNANLVINGNINVNDGAGFFTALVNGNTTLGNSAVTSLEGIYMSDGSFNTGNYNQTLNFRGATAAYGGFSLDRDLANNSASAAEIFEYAPDQIILFPAKLSARKINWKEVAP